jgi:hypothetical protein
MGTFFLLFTFDDPETTCPSAAGKLPDHFHLLLASQAVPLDSRSPPLYAAQVLCFALPVDDQPSALAQKFPKLVPEPPCHLEAF